MTFPHFIETIDKKLIDINKVLLQAHVTKRRLEIWKDRMKIEKPDADILLSWEGKYRAFTSDEFSQLFITDLKSKK